MRKKKNLLVILCDQLQRQTLGAYGGRIPTPRLDGLAERSAVFQEFYCASPLCVPTRPSMMTGRWPHAHGATTFGPGYETLNAGEQLLIDVLLDNGYHVDLPPTILDLLDLPPMERVQGRSLMPDLTGARRGAGGAAFVEFNGYNRGGIHTRGVVTDAYKYIYHHRDADQLFDRKADPDELRNLAKEPGFRGTRDDLRAQLAGWMRETGDFLRPAWPA